MLPDQIDNQEDQPLNLDQDDELQQGRSVAGQSDEQDDVSKETLEREGAKRCDSAKREILSERFEDWNV